MSIDTELKIPLYAKAALLLVGFYALISMLYIAQSIIVPIIFAFIIAILLHPFVNFLVKRKINRVLAIITSLLLTFIIIGAVAALIFSQVSLFSESWPLLVERFTDMLNQSIAKVAGYFNIKPQLVHAWIEKGENELLNTGGSILGQTLMSVGNALVVLFLVPVYVLIILYYHPLLIDFIYKVFGEKNQQRVSQIVTQIKTVIQRYLVGLLIEVVLVSTLNTVALLILGIEYALLLGLIGGLLNIIPYIGGIVAIALPMIVALATKSSAWYILYVMIAYSIIQLIDNNYIVPKVVASRVKINALFSIIVVIAGNALWGVSGMFLSIPLLAIIKLIFDNVESMKPWGFLLGDTMPPLLRIRIKRKNSGVKNQDASIGQ